MSNAHEVDFSQLISPANGTLRMIVWLHWLESFAQVASLLLARYWLDLQLPYLPIVLIVAGFVAWNLWSSRYFVIAGNERDLEQRVTSQLAVEIVVLCMLLYLAGGATNPFVSLFLIPLAIGAITLRFRIACLIAGLCVLSYTMLLYFHVPLNAQQTGDGSGFNLHVLGMWLNFLISAALVLVFLSVLASLARLRAEKISELREQVMRDQQINEFGGVAAGAAHALSTPLSTVAVILDELEEQNLSEQIPIARQQIELCRERLSEVLSSANIDRLGAASVKSVTYWLNDVIGRWRLLHPASNVQQEIDADFKITVDLTLEYSLMTLLDNAADANEAAGESVVFVRAHKTQSFIMVEVEDQGGGPVPQVAQGSTKAEGAGIGLLIANTNVRRLGGELLFKMGSNGCIAILRLPAMEEPDHE